VLKLIAANPDAVFIAATGGSAVLPQATLVDKGYKGRIYQTHGAARRNSSAWAASKWKAPYCGGTAAGRRRDASGNPSNA